MFNRIRRWWADRQHNASCAAYDLRRRAFAAAGNHGHPAMMKAGRRAKLKRSM